jgi:hypothetical protein
VEEVIKARGGPIWYQLYTTNNPEVTTRLVKRANTRETRAGTPPTHRAAQGYHDADHVRSRSYVGPAQSFEEKGLTS